MSVSALLSHTATIGGVRTRVLERPGDDALTLLLIHGWADSADTWKPLIAALDDLPARIVAFDLPSFGAAGDLQPGPQLPQFVATVAAALQQFAGRGRLLPVGQSLGGRALLMALHQADAASRAIPGCIVIGPAPLELPAWQKMLVRNGSLAPSASRLGEPLDAAQQRAEFLVRQAQVEPIERCSGHNGTYGVKREYRDVSMKIGIGGGTGNTGGSGR